jgi:CheY-like chemotaxis protein
MNEALATIIPTVDEVRPVAGSAVRADARRVLVLEDDAHAGSVMTDYLRSQGHAAELLPNGTDALWFVTKNQPDVVVMDIFMPGSDGLQAVRDIRARGPEIVIIAISGRFQHGEHFLRCARHLGATHVLPKPIDVAQLAVLVAGRPPVI